MQLSNLAPMLHRPTHRGNPPPGFSPTCSCFLAPDSEPAPHPLRFDAGYKPPFAPRACHPLTSLPPELPLSRLDLRLPVPEEHRLCAQNRSGNENPPNAAGTGDPC